MRYIDLPKELDFGVQAVSALLTGTEALTVRFEKADCLRVYKETDCVVVGYSQTAEAFRGLSMAKRVWETGKSVEQKAEFESLVAMIDCSRNAVMNVPSVKRMLTELAMLGFTGVMLYTEDTYEIPGHPYFGHMRGRYSAQELKELDAYALQLGMELIPCIQTLAHLNAIFNWTAYTPLRDTGDILLADNEPTYEFIEDMLKACRNCFTSRRINIGMDEAHSLGRGVYMDKNGLQPKSDIMLRHLNRVVELCKKYGFEPVMWSDMFFRMQFGTYNTRTGELSQEVLDKIPEEVALCYWNYYTPPTREAILDHMFAQHARTPNKLWFAGGSWGWSGITPKNYFSNHVTPTHLLYAKKYGVKHVIATAWGDDGAECSTFAVLPSFLQYAELRYGNADEQTLDDRCMDCFGIHYADFMKLDQLAIPEQVDLTRSHPVSQEKMALYNDVLMGIVDADLKELDLPAKYARDVEVLRSVPQNRYQILFDTQLCYAELLAAKTGLSERIKQAYKAGDKKTLAGIVEELPQIHALVERFHAAYRIQWMTFSKPFGFEVQDIRMGGLKARLDTAAIRLTQYINGEVEHLEELEQPDLPFKHDQLTDSLNSWRRLSTANIMGW